MHSGPDIVPSFSTEQKLAILGQMDQAEIRPCKKCGLCKQRNNTVFGEGDVDARILFIGEGPGENEDQTGRPFVGRAGELLDKMIVAIGLQRSQVYIANIVKCRPPDNRTPTPDEAATCGPYLVRQIETIAPKVIVTLGLPAIRFILARNITMGGVRGTWHSFRGIDVMPTYHPAYVLRSYTAEVRGKVWSDLKMAKERAG